MTAARKDPPRWSKLPVWLAAGVAAWALLFVLWRAVVVWPWPTGCLFAGILVGLLAGGRWRRQLRAELEAAQATIDRWNQADNRYALDEVGAVLPERTGEQPAVELYDQDADESYPHVELLERLGRTIGEHYAPGDRPCPIGFHALPCSCEPFADGERGRFVDGGTVTFELPTGGESTWAGASHLQADPADDTGTGTIAHLSGEWAPAAPAPKQVGQ